MVESVIAVPKHILSKQELSVKPYYPAFGVVPPDFDPSNPIQPQPKEIAIDCKPEIAGFINHNKTIKKQIEQRMNRLNCYVRWPISRGDKLFLHFSISANNPNIYFLAKGWEPNCERKMLEELGNFSTKFEIILQEIWKPFKEQTQQAKEAKNITTANLLTHFDDNSSMVHFCGFNKDVSDFQLIINQIKKALEAEMAKSKNRITDKCALKANQVYLLRSKQFVETMSSNEVEIKMTDTAVIFNGQPSAVTKAKIAMYEVIAPITDLTLDEESDGRLRMLNKPPVKQRLHDCFTKQKLLVTFEVHGKEVKISGLSQADLNAAKVIIQTEIVERKIELQPSCVSCLRTREWAECKSTLNQRFKLLELIEEKSAVAVISVKDEATAAENVIKEFLNKHVILEELVAMKEGMIEVLKSNCEDDIDTIKTRLKECDVDLKLTKNGCVVKSNMQGLRSAVEEVKRLMKRVHVKDHHIDKPSQAKFYRDMKTRLLIDSIGHLHKVSIKFLEDEEKYVKKSLGDPYMFAEVHLPSNRIIKLAVGDITKYKVDVIVNAANSRMEHGSGVAGAIVTVGMVNLSTFL